MKHISYWGTPFTKEYTSDILSRVGSIFVRFAFAAVAFTDTP